MNYLTPEENRRATGAIYGSSLHQKKRENISKVFSPKIIAYIFFTLIFFIEK